jgi:hypothetical protein
MASGHREAARSVLDRTEHGSKLVPADVHLPNQT